MAVKNLLVRGGADFSGIQKEMAKTQKTLSNFQSNVGGTMKKIGAILGGLAIGKLVKDSTQMAMGVESAIGNINRNMGTNAKAFQNWVNTQAQGYGIAKADAYKYGGTFSNLLGSFTKNTKETANQTTKLMKATAIIASKTGRSYEDTAERIRSGMLGSTEAIEDLGVYTNISMIESTEAFKRFANGKTWAQLDFQTQQQIRLAAILEQTYARYGNELANTTQTSHAQFIASLKNIQLAIGQAFLPIYSFVLPALTALANGIATVFNYIAQFTTALFGKSADTKKQSKATMQQAKATTGLGKATEKAGKKAKKAGKEAQGALMGFDEINQLDLDKGKGSDSGDTGSGGDGIGGAGTGMPPMDIGGFADSTVEVSEKVKAMADKVKSIISDVVSFISQNKDIIISIIGGIVAGFMTFKTLTFLSEIPAIIGAISTSLAVLLTPIGIASIAVGALTAAFIYLYRTNEDFRNKINQVWDDISKTMNSFINDTIKPIFKYLVNDFLTPLAKAFKEYTLPVLADIFVGVGKILNDILKLLQSTADNIWKIIKPGLDLIKTVVIDFLEIIKKLWDKYGKDLIDNVSKFIQGVQETMQLLWDNVLNPIIQPFLEMLSWLWDKHLKGLVEEVGAFVMKCVNGALEIYNGFIKPIVDGMIKDFGPPIANVIHFVIDVFGSMLAGIADIAKGLIRTLGGIIDFIVGVFTGNWRKAWQGVKDIFGGIFDSLVGLVKVPLNYIIDAINFVIRGLNKISIDTPDWIPGIGGKSFGVNISAIPKLAKGGVTNGPTMALIGDNPGGKEVVSPLDKLQNMLVSAVGTAMLETAQFNSSNNTGNSGDIILQVDGTTFARVINPYAAKEGQRIGNDLIIKTT